jgi:protoheme ferro-lyase
MLISSCLPAHFIANSFVADHIEVCNDIFNKAKKNALLAFYSSTRMLISSCLPAHFIANSFAADHIEVCNDIFNKAKKDALLLCYSFVDEIQFILSRFT